VRQGAGTKPTCLVSAVLDLEVADNAYVCFVWSATSFERQGILLISLDPGYLGMARREAGNGMI